MASVNYLRRDVKEPVVHLANYIPGKHRTPAADPHAVLIRDGREESSLSLERHGFIFTRQASKVNFYDDDEVRSVHYPELEEFFLRTSKAKEVIPIDFFVRTSKPTIDDQRTRLGAVSYIHSDFTDYFLQYPAVDLLKSRGISSTSAYRLVVLNVWRPLRGPVLRAPFAVCDASSVADEDLVETPQRRLGGTETHMKSAYYSPGHRWFYFPRMEEDEVIVFKSFDSARDGRARFVLHTSFDDPRVGPNAPHRSSFDIRVLLCLDKADEKEPLELDLAKVAGGRGR